ncbi:MAG: hypothetical protein L0Z73_02695, partial [Gammaproteobacteria bacterium]|nr:hypothetical protein [Gammaproteobacteria bacterium]
IHSVFFHRVLHLLLGFATGFDVIWMSLRLSKRHSSLTLLYKAGNDQWRILYPCIIQSTIAPFNA